MKWSLASALLLSAVNAAGQALPTPKPTAQVMLILPAQLGNPLFSRLTAALGEADLSFQFPLKNGLGFGVGSSAMFWEVKEKTFAPLLNTRGEAKRLAVYGKLNYTQYVTSIMFYEFTAKFGNGWWTWSNASCANDYTQSAFHWGVTSGLYVHATDNLAFGVTLGYERDAALFSPAVICQPEFLAVGLGFSTRFEKSKEEGW
jgi:hypothetical protein